MTLTLLIRGYIDLLLQTLFVLYCSALLQWTALPACMALYGDISTSLHCTMRY